MASVIKKTTVLYTDQALAFGGSLVVAGYMINSIDTEEFKPIFVGELDVSLMKHFTNDNVSIYKLSKLFNYSQWSVASKKLRFIPVAVFRKAITYLFSALRSILNTVFIIRFIFIILRERVDIVHVNNGVSNIEPIIAAIICRCKCVVHCHGVEKPGLFQRMILNKISRFIVISEYLKVCMVANGFPLEKMVVIQNPVQKKSIDSIDVDAMRHKYNLTQSDRVIGIVGRVVRWKGHIEFLEAAKLVLKKEPLAKVLIVGDYSDGNSLYQESITKLIDESGYKDRIVITGFVENVQSFYQLMDVCVHTSIKPEPFGLVITEAMSYGVPVVASDRGAPKEIINDGVNGFVVDPEETSKLAGVILRLLSDEELRCKIGERGSDWVGEVYNLDDYSNSIKNLYHSVLG